MPRTKVNKRADGRIEGSFVFNRKQYHVYARTTAELEEKKAAKRKELEENKHNHDDPTFDAYYKAWTDARRTSIRESTLHSQASQYNAVKDFRIKETGKTFKELRLSEITIDDIREVQRMLYEGDKRTTQTTNDIINHISHVFRTAVDEDKISKNPCRLVKPMKRTEELARDTTHRALTKEEVSAFLGAAKKSHYYDCYRMALNTGMRVGEIGALYSSDIKDGRINVERTITRCENGSYEIGDNAKTEHGKRSIPINKNISEIIAHQQEQNRILFGNNIIPIYDTLFKAPEGGLLMSTPINREIKRICKRIGIPYFTMHALRATFATRLIEQGINPRTVQELLGHADFAITMNLYGHCLDDTKKEAMQKLIIAV